MTGLLWPFAADWDREVRLTYEFMTEVITSENGKEQRISNRSDPRITIEYDSIVAEFDYQRAAALLNAQQNAPVLMSDWSRPATLSTTSTAADTRLPVVEVEPWMRAGVVASTVWEGVSGAVAIQNTITSCSTNWLNLSAVLGADVPEDAAVYRTWPGRLRSKISARLHTDRLVNISTRFDVDPGFENLGTIPPAPLLYQGRELFLAEPDWSADLSIDFEAVLETLDYGKGRVYHTTPVPFNTRFMSATYNLVGRDEIDALQNFFFRLRGQQGEFFMPTFTEDMRLRNTSGVGASQIRVIGTDAIDTIAVSEVHKNIALVFEDGQIETYEVVSTVSLNDELGVDSHLVLDRPLTRIARPSDVSMVCWLPLWRLLSDNMTVVWRDDQKATIGLSMKTLETLPAEVL